MIGRCWRKWRSDWRTWSAFVKPISGKIRRDNSADCLTWKHDVAVRPCSIRRICVTYWCSLFKLWSLGQAYTSTGGCILLVCTTVESLHNTRQPQSLFSRIKARSMSIIWCDGRGMEHQAFKDVKGCHAGTNVALCLSPSLGMCFCSLMRLASPLELMYLCSLHTQACATDNTAPLSCILNTCQHTLSLVLSYTLVPFPMIITEIYILYWQSDFVKAPISCTGWIVTYIRIR